MVENNQPFLSRLREIYGELNRLEQHVDVIFDTEEFCLSEKLFLAIFYFSKIEALEKKSETLTGWLLINFFRFRKKYPKKMAPSNN